MEYLSMRHVIFLGKEVAESVLLNFLNHLPFILFLIKLSIIKLEYNQWLVKPNQTDSLQKHFERRCDVA